MALEAAGLAIGAAALVGTFKDCIDVFGMIVAAHSLTDDAEVLNTKLDVEKMLLLQWAARTGLTEPERYDRRLDDHDLNQTVARVLEGIKRLLSDGRVLKDRYGLVDYLEERHGTVLYEKMDLSCTRLQQFIERFNRLSLHTEMPRREYSITARVKWVVRDKEKFASLINELSYFVSRLNALIPAHEQSSMTMTEEDMAQIRSIPQLKVIAQACSGLQPHIALIAQRFVRLLNQGRILDRLWFRWIDDRKARISDRHFRTLNWALEPPERAVKWDNLAEWLRCGSGLYWVAGKAGSGKSTLMKYLSDHPSTTRLLKYWVGQAELVTLQFFFFALGMPEQKSQEGILRSLLFQFLERHRDLIEHLLPATWREAIITEDQNHDLEMPSVSEMQISLLYLFKTISADKKFWILIDGLDEFEGKHATIAEFLSRLERLPNVKVLVSSRPLPAFVNAFNHAPKVYLQDLTKQDIEAYIYETILNRPRVEQAANIGYKMAAEIARLLIEKASGVFLWVILACRSILEGLEEYETGVELLKRITELPPELGDLFRQIISGLDPRKRDQSARLLRLVFESQTSSTFHPIPTMGLALVEKQGLRADFVGPSATGLSNEERVMLCQVLEGRIRSRCSGLVEIQVTDVNISLVRQLEPITAEGMAILNSRVVFLHRSLYEFLCTEGMLEWEALRVDNERGRFEPHLILASLWAQLAGLQPWGEIDFKNICLNNALVHNLHAGATHPAPRMLATNFSRLQGLFAGDGLYGLFGDLVRFWLPHQSKCRRAYEDLSVGLSLAAELGMVGLVQFALEDPDGLRCMMILPETGRLRDCNSFSNCPTRLYELNMNQAGARPRTRSTVFPLLYHATCWPFLSCLRKLNMGIAKADQEIITSTEVVRYLLEKGHDPNEEFCNTESITSTPWIRWLTFIGQNGRDGDGSNHENSTDYTCGSESDLNGEWMHQRALITMLFVDAGAELGAPGTYMCGLVDNNLWAFFWNAGRRSGRTSVKWGRSDALWLSVREKILSSRAAGFHRY